MPIEDQFTSILKNHLSADYRDNAALIDFPLWKGISKDSWRRRHGKTRILFVDDNISRRSDLFLDDDAETELLFEERLNCRIEYFEMPSGYTNGDKHSGGFDDAWFRSRLERSLEDEQPIALIVLDLLFGNQNIRDRERMAGVRFRRIIDDYERLRETPVIFASNQPRSTTSDLLKDFEASHKSYIQKEVVNLPDSLFCRTIEWGHISDPVLCAYSAPMRAVAQELRSFALQARTTDYESGDGKYPAPILFTGEFGSGKGWLAKRLHSMSTRRGKPIEDLPLTGASGPQDMTIKIFGTGPHQASQVGEQYVHAPTGALLKDGKLLLNVESMKGKIVTLYEIGALQRVDVGSELYPERDLEPKPTKELTKKGTLIVDELSETSQECQGKLIEVFNDGKFRPLFKSEQIPRDRCLDVWLMFLCSRKGWDREEGGVRPDLRDRLSHGEIKVPSLRNRPEDVLPLAMKVIAPLVALRQNITDPYPEQVFNDRAIEQLVSMSKVVSLRQFKRILGALPSVSSETKFSKGEVEEAQRRAGVKVATSPKSASHEPDTVEPNRGTEVADDRETYPQLTSKYAKGTLRILERELRAELGREGTVNGMSWEHLWDRLSPVKKKSNVAKDGITKMLLIDPEVTITAALNSKLLRALLESEKLRSTKLKSVLIEFRRRLASKDARVAG